MSTHYDTASDDDSGDEERTYWTPRSDYDWGEGTVQAREQRGNPDEDSAPEWWTDAYEIRMAAGLFEEVPSSFEPGVYDYEVYPDTLVHEKPAEQFSSAGGTDHLALGKRGSGKTTHGRFWALRLMEANPTERVVWRGSPQRSGWAAFREWATIWLPENASVEAMWRSERPGVEPTEANLAEEVRCVERYEDPVDLLDQLGDHPGGTFHVVYPDPSFTRCEELTKETDRVSESLPYTAAWETMGEETATPLQHWWFAFLLAAVEFREAQYWLSLIFDEAGDLAPEDAEEDDHRTWAKVSLLRSIYADTRKFRMSLYWYAHYEANLHPKFRREVERYISMPDGSPNPTTDRSRSVPLGFDTVPMLSDLIGGRDVGTALMFDESEFQLYTWPELSRAGEDAARWLKISLAEPDDAGGDEGPSLEYDSSVFKRWSAGDEDRLYVRDPGKGYIDAVSGAEVEALESPHKEMEFTGIREVGEERVVSMRAQGSDEETVVARIPVREYGLEDVDDLGEDGPDSGVTGAESAEVPADAAGESGGGSV